MNSKPDLGQRIFLGPTLILAGSVLYCGLILLAQMPVKDIFQAIGLVIAAEAYGTLAGLFVLLGLQYVLGPRSWIEQRIENSLSKLLIASAIMTAVIIVVIIAMVIIW
jgi:hypothetical protein